MHAATPRVAIVLVDFNGLADSRKCLQSLASADLAGARVILVDNGSTPETAGPLRTEFPWVTVIRNGHNGGWAGGNNVGIREARSGGADWIVLLNNDTIVAQDFVPRLLAAAAAHPDCGVLGPVIRFMDEPDQVMTDGVVWNGPGRPGEFFARLEVPIARTDPPTVVQTDIVNGCCMMVSESTFRRIGLVDERFFLIHEEADLCLRALRAGIHCGVISEALVWHKGSSTFRRSGLRHQRYYDTRNLALLLRNHARTHARGRSVVRAWFEYFRYVYYRWSIEVEAGEDDAANATVEGLADAFSGRYGIYQKRERTGSAVMARVFSVLHRVRPPSPSPTR